MPCTRPRPGRPVGTSAATLRSISESIASPSRSSSRVPKTSRIAARKSAQRAARGDDVQAEGEAAGGQLLELHLEVVEVGAQGAPAVDDQEHVAVPVVGPALRPAADR